MSLQHILAQIKKHKKYVIVGGILIIFIGILITFYFYKMHAAIPLHKGNENLPIDHVLMISSGKHIAVRIADTPQRQEWGLSYFSHLESDTGMLFLFPHLERQGFWMKDMHFPLDIVWLKRDLHDSNRYRIVSVEERVSPESYPKIFYPSEPIDTVLEIGAGNAQAWGIMPGQEGYLTKY